MKEFKERALLLQTLGRRLYVRTRIHLDIPFPGGTRTIPKRSYCEVLNWDERQGKLLIWLFREGDVKVWVDGSAFEEIET